MEQAIWCYKGGLLPVFSEDRNLPESLLKIHLSKEACFIQVTDDILDDWQRINIAFRNVIDLPVIQAEP